MFWVYRIYFTLFSPVFDHPTVSSLQTLNPNGLVLPGGAGVDDSLNGDGPAWLESSADEILVGNNLWRQGEETASEKSNGEQLRNWCPFISTHRRCSRKSGLGWEPWLRGKPREGALGWKSLLRKHLHDRDFILSSQKPSSVLFFPPKLQVSLITRVFTHHRGGKGNGGNLHFSSDCDSVDLLERDAMSVIHEVAAVQHDLEAKYKITQISPENSPKSSKYLVI